MKDRYLVLFLVALAVSCMACILLLFPERQVTPAPLTPITPQLMPTFPHINTPKVLAALPVPIPDTVTPFALRAVRP